jgi:hypothetical protein
LDDREFLEVVIKKIKLIMIRKVGGSQISINEGEKKEERGGNG